MQVKVVTLLFNQYSNVDKLSIAYNRNNAFRIIIIKKNIYSIAAFE